MSKTPPPIEVPADWQEMVLPFNIGSGRTLYSGLESGARIRMRVFKRQSDGSLVGRVWFGEGADGPPLHAHGGAIAYVLDEAMGAVGWMNDYPVVAAKLEFQYCRMTPLEVDLQLEAKILSATGKRLEVEARVKLPSGETCVESRGSFAILVRSKMRFVEDQNLDPQGFLRNPKLKWAPDDAG